MLLKQAEKIYDVDSWDLKIREWYETKPCLVGKKKGKYVATLETSSDTDIALRPKGDSSEGVRVKAGNHSNIKVSIGNENRLELMRFAPKEPVPRTGIVIIQKEFNLIT